MKVKDTKVFKYKCNRFDKTIWFSSQETTVYGGKV